ncbi:protein SON isoform X2 [Pseudophryne corroboree]|uniref:protein SON isoform X2 n=1 Tax=Pseudophryne corroboree TaxID=495146 RepID=UPI0030820916
MATNIEEIFRSFVVNKFKEIQEEEEKMISENSESSHNGDLTAQGAENMPEESDVCVQSEGNNQTAPKAEEMQPETLELVTPQTLVVEEEHASKELNIVEVSSSDEVKKDSSKKKSKKHKKHKSKKKKKKKKKEKNEKRSKSVSSIEDQENLISETKSVWKPAFTSPPRLEDLLSKTEIVNIDVLPLVNVHDVNIGSTKEELPARPQLDVESGFFGPKCPNEMNSPAICEAEMPEPLEESAFNNQQNCEITKCKEQDGKKESANSDTSKSQPIEITLSQPCLNSQEKAVALSSSTLSERKEDLPSLSDEASALVSRSRTKSDSDKFPKSAAKSRSRSKSLLRQHRSRSKSFVKASKSQQISSKSTTRQQSRSSSYGRRLQRSRSSSLARRQRSASKSPVRRRRSRSRTSKSPVRSWWSQSIKNRQRSVSVGRRYRSRTKSPARRHSSRSRSIEIRHRSRTRSSVTKHRSRSRSTNWRRKSRSTSRKARLRSDSRGRRRRSKSAKRRRSRSGSAARKRISRSGSVTRRQRSRSSSATRRRRSRSCSVAQRKRSGSADRRRRSPSASRRRRSRSPSASRRRRSRSPSATRRRRSRSPSATRRRRSRSLSATRRRRSPSATRRRRSGSARRRKSRSSSTTKRRKSRSVSAPRRRRSVSLARRHKSKSGSTARRRRSRSSSAGSKHRSRSGSVRRHRLRTGFDAKRQKSKSMSPTNRVRARSSSTARKGQTQSTTKNISRSARGRRSRSGSRSVERKNRSGSRASTELRRSRSMSLNKKQLPESSAEKETNSTLSSKISRDELELLNIAGSHSKSLTYQEQITSPVNLLEPGNENEKVMESSTFAAVTNFHDSPLKTSDQEKQAACTDSKSLVQLQNLSSPKEPQTLPKPSIECCPETEPMHLSSTQTDCSELPAVSINIFSTQKDSTRLEILNDTPLKPLKAVSPDINKGRLIYPVDEPEFNTVVNTAEYGSSNSNSEEKSSGKLSSVANVEIEVVQNPEPRIISDTSTNKACVPVITPGHVGSSSTTNTSKQQKPEVSGERGIVVSAQDDDATDTTSDYKHVIDDTLELANQNLVTLSNAILKSEDNAFNLKSTSKPISPANPLTLSSIEQPSHHVTTTCFVKDAVVSNKCSNQDFRKSDEVYNLLSSPQRLFRSETSAHTEKSSTWPEQGISSYESNNEMEQLHYASPTIITSEARMKPSFSPAVPHKDLDLLCNRQAKSPIATAFSSEALNSSVLGSPRTVLSASTQLSEQGILLNSDDPSENYFSKQNDATVSNFKSSIMTKDTVKEDCSDGSQAIQERLYLSKDSNSHDCIPIPTSGSEREFTKSSSLQKDFQVVKNTDRSVFTQHEQNSTVSNETTEESMKSDDLVGSFAVDKPVQKGILPHEYIDLCARNTNINDLSNSSEKSGTFSEVSTQLELAEASANLQVLGKHKSTGEPERLHFTHLKSSVLNSAEIFLICHQKDEKTVSSIQGSECFEYSPPHKESGGLQNFPPLSAAEQQISQPLTQDKLHICVSTSRGNDVCSVEEKTASLHNQIPPYISYAEHPSSKEQNVDLLESEVKSLPASIKPDESDSGSSDKVPEHIFDIPAAHPLSFYKGTDIKKQIYDEGPANSDGKGSYPKHYGRGLCKPLTADNRYEKHKRSKGKDSSYSNAREGHTPSASTPIIGEHEYKNLTIAADEESLVVIPSTKKCSDSPMIFKLDIVNVEKSHLVAEKISELSEMIVEQTASEVRKVSKDCSLHNSDNLDSSVVCKDMVVDHSRSSKQTEKEAKSVASSNYALPCNTESNNLSTSSTILSNTTKIAKLESRLRDFVKQKNLSASQDYEPASISRASESKYCNKIPEQEHLQLDVLETDKSSHEKLIKPFSAVSSHLLNQKKSSEIGFNLVTLLPKHETVLNREQKNSKTNILSSVKPIEASAVEENEKAHISHSKGAHVGSKPNKPHIDQILSFKPTLHDMKKSSEIPLPLHFKFTNTFKSVTIPDLCNISEDSSGIETSKNKSSPEPSCPTTLSSEASVSSLGCSLELPSAHPSAIVCEESSKSSSLEKPSPDEHSVPPQLDSETEQPTGKNLLPDNIQGSDDSQSCSTKHAFPHLSNALSKSGVKQRQYRSRSVARDSRSLSGDRGRTSRSRSKSTARRRRSHSKSVPRKKRSQSSTRKKSSHSKSVKKKRSRSRSGGRKRRSQSKSKGKKKRSPSKSSGKRKRSSSKSSERTRSVKPLGKQRSSRSKSKTRKNRLQSKSPGRKGRSRSKSGARKSSRSKTSGNRKSSRSYSPAWRRQSRSKSFSSRSRSRSLSASPKRCSRSRNKGRSLSRSPAPRHRSRSRSRARWNRSRSRGRWCRSRSLSTSRRRRSRSSSRLSRSLSTKKRKSLSKSPVRRRRSRSQAKQKDKSPVSKPKSTSPLPQKKIALSKSAAFKHSIGLKSLIQKQLSQAKSKGVGGKLSVKEQIPLPTVTARAQLPSFSTRANVPVPNLTNVGQIPVPNLADVPLPTVTTGGQIPLPSVPPAEQLSVSNLVAETQLSVPDLTNATQWHVPDMSSGSQWPVPDIATGTPWSVTDLGNGTQWPMSDLAAGSHWPLHDMTVGTQWSVPDLAAGTQWSMPDVATGAQWAVPDLTAGAQWTVPDLTAGPQWAMTNLAPGTQWAVPDLAATTQWTVPDLTSGAQLQGADMASEAQVPGSDLALEAQVPGSDLVTEAQVPGSDLATEAQVPGSDMVSEAQVPPEHELAPETLNLMPDVAAEALVPVASGTLVPDVAAGIQLPDVAAVARMPVPDVAATTHMPMPDVATTGQNRMSDFVPASAYMSAHEPLFDVDNASKPSIYSDFVQALSPEEHADRSALSKPIASPEHQPPEHQAEAERFDTNTQQSTHEPMASSYHKNKLSSSSVQFPALSEPEYPLSSELNVRTSPLDKQADQIVNVTMTEMPENCSQILSCADSAPHPDSETCSTSEIAFIEPCLDSEHQLLTVEHTLSICPLSNDSTVSHEHGLFIEPHASSDGSFLVESLSGSDRPLQVEASDSPDCLDSHPLVEPYTSPDCTLLIEPYHSPDHNLLVESYSKPDHTLLVAPYASPDHLLLNEQCSSSDSQLVTDLCSGSDNSHLVETCTSPEHTLLVEPYVSPERPQLVEPYVSPERPQLVVSYASPERPQLVISYASPERPQLVVSCPSPERPQLVESYASPERPQLVESYASPERPQLVESYASPERPQLVESYASPERPQLVESYASPERPQLVESYPSPERPQLVESYPSPERPQLVESYPSPERPQLVESYPSPERPQLVESYPSPERPLLVESYPSPERPQLVEPYASPVNTHLLEPYSSPECPQLVEPYCSPDRPQLVEPYASPDHPQLVEPYASPDHVQTCKPYFSLVLTETFCSPAEAIPISPEKPEDEVCSSPSHPLALKTSDLVQHPVSYNPPCSNDISDKTDESLDSSSVDPIARSKLIQNPQPTLKFSFDQLDECSVQPAVKPELDISDCPHLDKPVNIVKPLPEETCQVHVQTYSHESGSSPSQAPLEECCSNPIKNISKELYGSPQHSNRNECTDHLLSNEHYAKPAQVDFPSSTIAQLDESCSTIDHPKHSPSDSHDQRPLDETCASPDQLKLKEQCVSHDQSEQKPLCATFEPAHSKEDYVNTDQPQPNTMYTVLDHPHQEEYISSALRPNIDEHCSSGTQAPLVESMHISSESLGYDSYSSSHKPLHKYCLDHSDTVVEHGSINISDRSVCSPYQVPSSPNEPLPAGDAVAGLHVPLVFGDAASDLHVPLMKGEAASASHEPLPGDIASGHEVELAGIAAGTDLAGEDTPGEAAPCVDSPLAYSITPGSKSPVQDSVTPGSKSPVPEREVGSSVSPVQETPVSCFDQIPSKRKAYRLQPVKPPVITEHLLADETVGSLDNSLLDRSTTTADHLLVKKPLLRSDRLLQHESLEICKNPFSEESFHSPRHSPKDNLATPDDCSEPCVFSAKTNQTLPDGAYSNASQPDAQKILQTDDPLTSDLPLSAEPISNKYASVLSPGKNTSCAADLPCSNQDQSQTFTSNQVSVMSVESASEDPDNHLKISHHYKISPPDLLPYDSEQPTGMSSTSEPSNEPVLFNSQPPPELLPYDSEQPANPFLSIADYSSDQSSSVFHTPPELLPYDSDQPTVLSPKKSSDTCVEELPVCKSTNELVQNDPPVMLISLTESPEFNALSVDCFSETLPKSSKKQCDNEQFPSSSLKTHEQSDESCKTETAPHHVTSVNELSVSIKFDTLEGTIMKDPLEEEVGSSETLAEHTASITSVAHISQELSCSVSSVDKPVCVSEQPCLSELPSHQPFTKIEQSLQESVLVPELPMKSDCPIYRIEDQTEQTSLLSNISPTSEILGSAEMVLVNVSESELSTEMPATEGVVTLEATTKCSQSTSLSKTDIPQSLATATENESHPESKSRMARSQSRSEDRRKSRSKSATRKKRSRSKSGRNKSHSKSPLRMRRSRSTSATEKKKSRSASDTRKRRSPSAVRKRRSRSASLGRGRHSRSVSVAKGKDSRSRSVARRRSSRSPSTARRRRSRSSSFRKRSHSSSVGRKQSRSPSVAHRRRSRSHSLSRRRHSRSASTYRRRHSRSPSVTRRRRSPSVTRRKRSRSPSVSRRRRSPSPPVSRKRRSPSPPVSRRRRSPSPSVAHRRRSPSPPVVRRKHSPSQTVVRRRRSRSPSASRRKRSGSQSASRKRRSRSSSAPRKRRSGSKSPSPKSPINKQRAQSKSDRSRSRSPSNIARKRKTRSRSSSRDKNKSIEKRRKRSSSKDHYSIKQRRKSRTPPRRKKSRSPARKASVCKSPVRRRRSRSPVRRKSFSRSPVRRKRSRSRDQSMDSMRSPKRLTDLDKAQLLEIAKANAAAMCVKAGVPLPLSLKPITTPAAPSDEKITHRTYGVTIQELTEKCKQIAQSKEDDVIVNKPHDSDEEEGDQPFYNHPFKVSDHKPISFSLMNPSLKPAPKTQVTLTKEFPVSSGSQHRKKESDKVYGEWVPVDKKSEESKDDVFTNTVPSQSVDITSAMNERAVAQTRLTGNPFDLQALSLLNRAQEQIDAWALSTSIPGQFTGSTGAQVLTADEISNSGPQAWLKKQVLTWDRTLV